MFYLNILGLKDAGIALPQLSTASINVEFVVDPDWTGFKFITKKRGAQGPTKEDCKNYYADWYVSYHHSLYFKFKSSLILFFFLTLAKMFVTEIQNKTF